VIGCVVFGMCVTGLIGLLLFAGSKKTPSAASGVSYSAAPVAVPPSASASASAPEVDPEKAGLNSSFSIEKEDVP